jgi:hypothetical protein
LRRAEATRSARRRKIVWAGIDQATKPELQVLPARPVQVIARNRLLAPIGLYLLANTLGRLIRELR